jgi:hypothetical protein
MKFLDPVTAPDQDAAASEHSPAAATAPASAK